jgi:hypothetical protein
MTAPENGSLGQHLLRQGGECAIAKISGRVAADAKAAAER